MLSHLNPKKLEYLRTFVLGHLEQRKIKRKKRCKMIVSLLCVSTLKANASADRLSQMYPHQKLKSKVGMHNASGAQLQETKTKKSLDNVNVHLMHNISKQKQEERHVHKRIITSQSNTLQATMPLTPLTLNSR